MTFDEMFKHEIARNPEFAKFFEEHPERKELYKQKVMDSSNEIWGCRTIDPKYCMTCAFKHGDPPFADLPEKAYCAIYTRESGVQKPPNVYYDGGLCEYYQNENEIDEEADE